MNGAPTLDAYPAPAHPSAPVAAEVRRLLKRIAGPPKG